MARYIDADKLIDMCKGIIADDWNKRTSPVSWADAYEGFIEDIDEQPTADVVQKSEVLLTSADAARKILELHGYYNERYENIKTEVAREIFEEIEKWLATDGTLLIITAKKFAEIKNKYMEE